MNEVNTNDISIDCESLAVDYDAPIIAVGAVAFDHTTGKTGQTFYEEVSIASAIQHSRVNASTLSWWMTQSPRARQIFSNPDSNKKSLSTVLFELMTWARTVGKGTPVVWAKGPQEDITWLRHALHVSAVGTYEAWHYNNVRDVRTLTVMAQEIQEFNYGDVEFEGVQHNALDDAKYQAAVVSHCYKLLGGKAAYVPPSKPLRGKVTPKPTDDEEI